MLHLYEQTMLVRYSQVIRPWRRMRNIRIKFVEDIEISAEGCRN